MKIEIKLLTKKLKDDYLYFFDNITFEDNPDRAKCYCYDYHFLGVVETCTRETSRSSVSKLIDENKLRGYLAYDNDKVIGWCNANNRSNYERLLRDYDYVDNPDDKVCSIVCFLIHPDYRRKGIAQMLLEQVIHDYSNKDYDFLEAYPKKAGVTCEDHFKGPLELYTKLGFRMEREDGKYLVMRRAVN